MLKLNFVPFFKVRSGFNYGKTCNPYNPEKRITGKINLKAEAEQKFESWTKQEPKQEQISSFIY